MLVPGGDERSESTRSWRSPPNLQEGLSNRDKLVSRIAKQMENGVPPARNRWCHRVVCVRPPSVHLASRHRDSFTD